MSGENLPALADLMRKLRNPEGCPWDREQTHQSLKHYLIEEAYEVLEAIENKDYVALREELGDLLLQVVFHAQLAEEENRFDLTQVIEEICQKLIRRHPHVFAGLDLKTSGQVLARWKRIKAEEKGIAPQEEAASLLDGLPKHLPPLTESVQITRRAAEVGFDWPTLKGIFDKLREEIAELQEAIRIQKEDAIRDELGDLLFVAANLARRLDIDPHLALQGANRKFQRRFRGLERELGENGRTLNETSLEEMDTLWEKGKRAERGETDRFLQSRIVATTD